VALRWYVVHAYSNFEHRVAESLKERIKRASLEPKFGEILVPTEEVVEMRDGQKRRSERKFYPGYVLVQMEMDEDTWHLVREVPKVLGFIGGRSCAASRKAPTSRGRRCSSSRAKWCVWSMVRSTTSTVSSRT
jgi:transcription antitermination factor NusG